jgi:ATP-binding cassette subfamily F protein uup
MKEQVQPAKPAKRRLSYKEQKEWEEIEDKIAALETKLQEITLEMEQAASDYEKVQRLASEDEQLSAELDALLERWAELSELVEALQSKSTTQ